MKRIIIIGCPGSGKSTFAKALHSITDIPLYHLDMMYWNEDRTVVPKDIFIKELNEILNKEQWIIDGNYGSTMEQRIEKCDTVFFLDYPLEVCIEGINSRRGKPRSDMPWNEKSDEVDEEFLAWVNNYNVESRPEVMELLSKYSDKEIIIFKTRDEARAFLDERGSMKYDCGFTKDKKWFRYCAAAIIVEDGCVLFAGNEIDDYYYSIGGGVHMGETAEDAVKREVFEETGVHYEIDRLAVIHENFFNENMGALKGLDCHEIAMYFLMKPRGTKKLNSDSYSQGVREKMYWIPIDELDKHKAFPTFMKDYLQTEHSGIEHIVTDERLQQ